MILQSAYKQYTQYVFLNYLLFHTFLLEENFKTRFFHLSHKNTENLNFGPQN